MVSEHHYCQFVRERDKSEAPRQSRSTLEDVTSQLPNSEAAVDVRVPKSLAKVEESHHRADLVSVG